MFIFKNKKSNVILIILLIICFWMYFSEKFNSVQKNPDYVSIVLDEALQIDEIHSTLFRRSPQALYILNKNELIDILINDYDNYYNTFNYTDLKVRNVNSIGEYKEICKTSPITISKNEINIINKSIYKIRNILKNYNSIGFNGSKANKIDIIIGIVNNKDYEEGLPHTRYWGSIYNKYIIIIPKYLIDTNNLTSVLFHELVHIYQKVYPKDIEIYLDTLKFKKYAHNNNQTRSNPDIDEYIYSDVNNELLYCIYKNNPKSIMDVIYFPLNNETNEHPFEMMAYNIESDIKEKYNL
jgi:hypothetical protein